MSGTPIVHPSTSTPGDTPADTSRVKISTVDIGCLAADCLKYTTICCTSIFPLLPIGLQFVNHESADYNLFTMLNPASVSKLKSSVAAFPAFPGVYFFKNAAGKVLYIGKAKNLRARVKQYFQNHDTRPQIPFLLKEAADVEYTVVNTELESLYLERTLIQKYHPKYNIELRDDKSYTFIAFDYFTEIPQILITRRLSGDTFQRRRFFGENRSSQPENYRLAANNYFGPYTAAYKVREILKTIRYIFPYCLNAKVSQKPCFYYHLHRCPGVCVGVMSLADYKLHLEKIKLFLKGDIAGVKKRLQAEMREASAKKLYEKAARCRDQLKALLLIEQKQSVIIPKKVDWDIVSEFGEDNAVAVTVLKVRQGKLLDKENFVYQNRGLLAKEAMQTFLEDYYSQTSDRPQKIYTQDRVENGSLIKQLLFERFGKKINLARATQKQPLRLAEIAQNNAREFLKQRQSQTAASLDKISAALVQLKEVLGLPVLPKRIECYDISNIQGTNPVGSMVVFIDGKPAKAQYRKFKIKSPAVTAEGLPKPDDFAMMREMLERRKERLEQNDAKFPKPDLMVIDGGKGQLSTAVSVFGGLGSTAGISVIGLAKRIEEIFQPGKSKAVVLGHDQPALQLLQRLRDEAHRFGVTFHRALRSKQAVKSALDEIVGIGPKTKKRLKEKFGTVAAVRQASWENLAKAVGKKLAKKIKTEL